MNTDGQIVSEPEQTKVAEEDLKLDEQEKTSTEEEKPEVKYFQCSTCVVRVKYEYFGRSPPFVKDYRLEEDAYVIEDPFLPPKRGEFLVLGAHCVKCNMCVCKDTNCSIYFGGTYCIQCAKQCNTEFPTPVREKLNRIVIPSFTS